MGLHRLTSITLGVPDPAASGRFFTDFGLSDEGDGWFATRDGGRQLELVGAPRRQLRRLGVGAADGDDIGRIVERARRVGGIDVEHSDDGKATLRDPGSGVLVEVTVADPYRSAINAPALNRPGHIQRLDRPALSVLTTDPVRPANLTHVVLVSPDQPATLRFVVDVLGFEISDQLPGVIAFTRCGEVHHNLAVQAGPVTYPHHVAFETDGVDDVVRGGHAMIERDPARHTWGVGRHAIGSNWFWYLRDPSGTFVEYTADVDRISSQEAYSPKQWRGREFLYSFGPPAPPEFLDPPDLAAWSG